MPTQLEYNLAKQKVRIIYYKIVLLNYQFQNVGEVSGDTIETPSFTIDANSDIRRTCSVIFTPRDSSFDIKQGNKIWLDKYVQIFVGQKDIRTKNIEYTKDGTKFDVFVTMTFLKSKFKLYVKPLYEPVYNSILGLVAVVLDPLACVEFS